MNNAALYRRLGPIQDAYYEQKNYKGVVRTCEASLKKDPNQVHVKCYLALAKQQLGHVEEAMKLFESIVSMIRAGDGDFLLRLYKAALEGSGQTRVLAEALEKFVQLHAKQPTVESIKAETLLFHVYFRLGEYQKATKQAMRVKMLAAGEPENAAVKVHRALIWSILCNFWNAKHNPQAAMSLTLAERMLSKLAEDGKLTNGEDVSLYCDVLQVAGKLGEARKVAEGPLGEKAFPFEEERLKFICKILDASDDQPAVLAARLKILRVSPDDWDAWEGAMNASETLDDIATLAQKLADENPSKRGPRLAEIEVALRRQEEGRLAELLLAYFIKFGDKACFWGDVARYVHALGPQKGGQLVQEMEAVLGEVDWTTEYPLRESSPHELESADDPHREQRDGRDTGKVDTWSAEDEARQRQMRRRVGLEKLRATLGEQRAAEQCQEMCRQYEAACSLYRKHLQITEEGPNDDLIIVAAHHLRRMGKLVDAMSLCLAELSHTPHAFQPKLLLIQLAMEMGAFDCAFKSYKDLECKYVQNDSMGHFALPAVIRAGDAAALSEVCQAMTEWRNVALKRAIPSDTSKCFSHGKWTQLEGFEHFAKRVDGSVHFLSCEVELLLSQICTAKTLSADVVSAIVRCGRERGLDFAGSRPSRNWLEEIVSICGDYRGKDDLRLACNYDYRVQTDFTALQSKTEFLASEWVVSSELCQWLQLRTLVVLVLETAAGNDAAAFPALLEKLQVAAGGVRAERHFGRALPLLLGLVEATSAAASCGVEDFSPVVAALQKVQGACADLKAFLATEEQFPALSVTGWSDALSSVAFEVSPAAAVMCQSWKKFAQPTKSVRNKMAPAVKESFAAMLSHIQQTTVALEELSKTVGEISKKRATEADAAVLLKWAQKDSALGSESCGEHLETACKMMVASWKALYSNVAARTPK